MDSVGQTCSQNVQRMQSSRAIVMPAIPCVFMLMFSLKSLLNSSSESGDMVRHFCGHTSTQLLHSMQVSDLYCHE